MAQKRLSDFFSSVSNWKRSERNEDKTVELLNLNQREKQDEKDKQEVEKGKQVTTMLWKFRVEWKQLYPWLDYNNRKMFCLYCCEFGNLSDASSSFVTGGCTNLKIDTLRSHDISTGLDNMVKARYAQKNPAVQLLLYLNCIIWASTAWPVQLAFCPVKIWMHWTMDQYTKKLISSPVHWCVTVDYQQIPNGKIANQIHGFTIDYGKFILIENILQVTDREDWTSSSHLPRNGTGLQRCKYCWNSESSSLMKEERWREAQTNYCEVPSIYM